MVRTFALLFVFLISTSVFAAKTATPTNNASSSKTSDSSSVANYSFFAGTGVGLSFPGPLRMRFFSTEIGTYGPSLGVAKVFRMGRYYSEFGGALGVAGQIDLGVIAAMGIEDHLFWILNWRSEVYSYFGFKGYSFTGVSIGLSINF